MQRRGIGEDVAGGWPVGARAVGCCGGDVAGGGALAKMWRREAACRLDSLCAHQAAGHAAAGHLRRRLAFRRPLATC